MLGGRCFHFWLQPPIAMIRLARKFWQTLAGRPGSAPVSDFQRVPRDPLAPLFAKLDGLRGLALGPAKDVLPFWSFGLCGVAIIG